MSTNNLSEGSVVFSKDNTIVENLINKYKNIILLKAVNETRLSIKDMEFIEKLITKEPFFEEIHQFVKDLGDFHLSKIPVIIKFIVNKIQIMDKKKLGLNLLEIIRFVTHSSIVAIDLGIPSMKSALIIEIVDNCIDILETNLTSEKSKGCFFFF